MEPRNVSFRPYSSFEVDSSIDGQSRDEDDLASMEGWLSKRGRHYHTSKNW